MIEFDTIILLDTMMNFDTMIELDTGQRMCNIIKLRRKDVHS